MDDPGALAQQAADELSRRTGIDTHDVAVVLGSGWAPAATSLGEPDAAVPMADLAGFTPPSAAGHGGQALSLRIGQVLDNPEARTLAERCATEAYNVARAKGISLDFTDLVRRIHEFGRVIPDARPSMLLDVLAGRESEIDVLNEALVREAERAGLSAPTNALLAQLVRALERKNAMLRTAYGVV